MNRLIIIGNGFDLAHGLPTSYKHFIDDYWGNVISILKENKRYEDDCVEIEIRNINDLWLNLKLKQINNYKSLEEAFRQDVLILNFKNLFLKKISEINNIHNWVDVENEYYNILTELIKPKTIPDFNGLGIKNNENDINRLNADFEKIKELLENYLVNKVEDDYSLIDSSKNPFLEYIKANNELTNKKLNQFFNELPFNLSIELNKQLLESPNPENLVFPILSVSNYFLNFNYTDTLLKYFKMLNINERNINHLHGRLKNNLNPINFGFGDEIDKHYPLIEEKNENEYLKNIKSFQYLNTPNYKDLLDYIDSEVFQVYIMGHSCGLSDRTLLNTIFEHSNCRSIKVFYHEKKDKNGNVISDNFTELIQNISRHFNDKKLMRSKIVNKTLCQPLPQIKLPKKE